MRSLITVLAIGFVASLLGGPPAASQEKAEWVDLLARDCKDWSRDGGGKTPWQLTADRTLVGAPPAGGTDVIGPDRPFGDGTLKFEYRFRPAEPKAKSGYKAAVHVRGRASATWCRMALGDDCGTLSSSGTGSSDRPHTVEAPGPAGLAREPGFWNLVKVSLRGRSAEFFVNGRLAATFAQADAGDSRIALEAGGPEVEFRRVMWKDVK